MKLLTRFAMDESGDGAVEYGLLAGMIACFVLSALQKVGLSMTNKFNVVAHALS